MEIELGSVKARSPIAEVVGRHGGELRAQGRRFAGCCPFHRDDRPSLIVYPQTGSFHCFGCGAGGDVIEFVRRAEGLDFRDAIARLAAAAPRARRQSVGRSSAPLSLEDRPMLLAACAPYHGAPT